MLIDFLKRLYLSLFSNSTAQSKPILVSKQRKHKQSSDEDSKRSNKCNYE